MPRESSFPKRLLSRLWPWRGSDPEESKRSGAESASQYSTDEEVLPAETTPPHEADCPQMRNRASDYLEGSLSGGWVKAIKRHLAKCKACAAFINTFKATVDMMRGIPRSRAPEGVRRGIIEAISKYDPESPP